MSDTCTLAADLLEAEAVVLLACHNVDPQHPTWEGEPEALAAHDMAMDLAQQLRNISNYLLLLEGQYAAEKDRADYAWRNTNTIEKARQEEMAKRDALQAEVAARGVTIMNLLEILRQWEPDHASGKDRRTIVMAMYQVGILTDPTKTTAPPVPTSAD